MRGRGGESGTSSKLVFLRSSSPFVVTIQEKVWQMWTRGMRWALNRNMSVKDNNNDRGCWIEQQGIFIETERITKPQYNN